MRSVKSSENSNWLDSFKLWLTDYTPFLVFSLIVLIFARFIELIVFAWNQQLPEGFFSLLTHGLLQDLVFWLSLQFPLFLIYSLLRSIHKKIALYFMGMLIVSYFLIHFLLVFYFKTTQILLGSDLFGYSIDDISLTIKASGALSVLNILGMLAVLAILILGLHFSLKKLRLAFYASLFTLAGSLVVLLAGFSSSIAPNYTEDFANNLAKNKSAHFYEAAYDYFRNTRYRVDIYADDYLAQLDQRLAQQGRFDYLNAEYPFLHKASNRDVLSPFLNAKKTPPNIVIIIVEGLGRAFTNEGAYLGNFTPFLDSLSTQSLYFKNMLSNGGRTFAVLPAILGSQPFAENGFTSLGNTMPPQLSLINILNKNGYKTSFFYGGDSSFDNMSIYLKRNNIGTIEDEQSIPKTYSKLPENSGFSWGYGDRELYAHYLNSQLPDTLVPRLDVLLTVTTHSPFKIPDQNRYKQRFEERINTLDLSADEIISRQAFSKEFETVLYADQALKDFFESYSKRPDYENTLFLITGDHRIPEIPMATTIDRYHVPLMVYSPLLKKAKSVEAISSHFDIAPSLLSYLKNSYALKVPGENAFLSKGLDTISAFRNIHQIPLKQTKTNLIDFVSGTYHLNGDRLFKLLPTMYEEPYDDPAKKQELKAEFINFKQRNQKIADGAALVPDSLVIKYTQ